MTRRCTSWERVRHALLKRCLVLLSVIQIKNEYTEAVFSFESAVTRCSMLNFNATSDPEMPFEAQVQPQRTPKTTCPSACQNSKLETSPNHDGSAGVKTRMSHPKARVGCWRRSAS